MLSPSRVKISKDSPFTHLNGFVLSHSLFVVDLSATQGGEKVDYENVLFDNLVDKYYYTPDDMYHLVDYNAFHDRCMSSGVTPRRSGFCEDICRRDNGCAITGEKGEACDATHIIPHSKGSGYITYVIRDRSSLYEQLPFSLEDDIEINCIEDGILLRSDIYRRFCNAKSVFLKTPSFAMVPADVPWIEHGPVPHNRTTLHDMKPPMGRCPILQWDVRADWSRDDVHPPPSIVLDFMYGAAVVQYWVGDGLNDMLEKRFKDDFSKVLAENPRRSIPEDDESFSSDPSPGLLKAIDKVLLLSMLLKGITPQKMAAEWEKQNTEKERSSEKVRQWLNLDASNHLL